LREAEILNEVVILLKNIKTDNPALEILRKNMERKRKTVCICLINQMEKYEKIEFDMNTIDSAL
jgi:precorrin-3B methylase